MSGNGEGGAGPSARVLVVDDDPTVREIATSKLSADGHSVVAAADGAEGWRRLQRQAFDLALIDLEMPEIDGFTLIERIRADPVLRHLPVIVITSRQDEEAVDRAFDAGANSFVSKPLIWPSLQRQVRYVWRASANERELRRAKDQAEGSVRLKNNFLSVINHELRTPLTHIIGFAEVLQRQAEGPLGAPSYAEYVDQIAQAGRRLLGNITEVILLSRGLSGELQLSEGEYPVSSVVRDVLEELHPIMRLRDVTVEQAPMEEDWRILCDIKLFSRCLIALLDNAVKFSPDGGVVHLSAGRTTSGGLSVRIADSGPGMSEVQIADCYEPFVQSDMSFRRSAEGIGLGLTLVRTLTDLHGGELMLRSQEGRGTTATLTLPARRLLTQERPAVEDVVFVA